MGCRWSEVQILSPRPIKKSTRPDLVFLLLTGGVGLRLRHWFWCCWSRQLKTPFRWRACREMHRVKAWNHHVFTDFLHAVHFNRWFPIRFEFTRYLHAANAF